MKQLMSNYIRSALLAFTFGVTALTQGCVSHYQKPDCEQSVTVRALAKPNGQYTHIAWGCPPYRKETLRVAAPDFAVFVEQQCDHGYSGDMVTTYKLEDGKLVSQDVLRCEPLKKEDRCWMSRKEKDNTHVKWHFVSKTEDIRPGSDEAGEFKSYVDDVKAVLAGNPKKSTQ